MNKRIYKYPINLEYAEGIVIKMPEGAEILTIQMQKAVPCIWALVDTDASVEVRTFRIYGTGHPVKYDHGVLRNYIGTFQLYGGDIVLHLFEV